MSYITQIKLPLEQYIIQHTLIIQYDIKEFQNDNRNLNKH